MKDIITIIQPGGEEGQRETQGE